MRDFKVRKRFNEFSVLLILSSFIFFLGVATFTGNIADGREQFQMEGAV